MKSSNLLHIPCHQFSCPSPLQQSLTSRTRCKTAFRHFLCLLSTLPAFSPLHYSILNHFSQASVAIADSPLIRIIQRLRTTEFSGQCLSQGTKWHLRQLITASFFKKNPLARLLIPFVFFLLLWIFISPSFRNIL